MVEPGVKYTRLSYDVYHTIGNLSCFANQSSKLEKKNIIIYTQRCQKSKYIFFLKKSSWTRLNDFHDEHKNAFVLICKKSCSCNFNNSLSVETLCS